MLTRLLIAWGLLALSVTIHCAGLAAVSRHVLGLPVRQDATFGALTWLLVRVAGVIILLHLSQIAVWALFYRWQHCLPDLESAFYFSGVTYTTLGYGDLLLPKEWRLFGPVEGLTGILMCGLSTGFFFAVVSRFFAAKLAANSR